MRIQRYLSVLLLKSILGTLSLSLIIFNIVTYLDQQTYYWVKYNNVKTSTIVAFYAWDTPKVLILILPLALFIGAVTTSWSLSRQGEMTALRSLGYTPKQFGLLLLGMGLSFSFASILLNETVVPWSQRNQIYIKKTLVENTVFDAFLKTQWIHTQQAILHYQDQDISKKIIFLPEYFVLQNSNQIKTIVRGDFATFDSSQRIWILHNAHVWQIAYKNKSDLTGFILQEQEQTDYKTEVNFIPPLILKITGDDGILDQFGFFELKRLIENARKSGLYVLDQWIILKNRISFPFSCTIFILMALPFAFRHERQNDAKMYLQLLASFIFIALYLLFTLLCKILAIHEVIGPNLGTWLPNGIFFCLAAMMISYYQRRII